MTDRSDRTATTPDRLRQVLDGCATGALPPNIALLRLVTEAVRPEEVEDALARASTESQGEAAGRLGAALALCRENPQAFGYVKSVLHGVDHDGPTNGQGVAHWADTFDRLAMAAPEGGVALYALGNPDLLKAATEEVVAWLAAHRLTRSDARVVEIGCGIGRFVAALAPHVGHVTGLDISPGMIARAQERCAGLPNVALRVSSGADLADVPDGAADLVLAADVFPYLVQAGGDVATTHIHEAARVLAEGGHLAILNYSYRGDSGRDLQEIEALAAPAGLVVRRSALQDFSLWDAATFLLGKNQGAGKVSRTRDGG
ncbi:class I SAM-dependent methyltransferase [Rubellimicrobium rubrum]|uniref:Class I SAM-dependent methyltransferase n=1 Tax=Rubellimicrobium rubrum TaxID=2585369 RepID=A0A5C4MNC8_9RHOB|nr:class I SAM-dependent methyltransferase [Rubellimicrobium rubrum]TNC44161.1 class I SAM-dependent methyltransferase [Rubellimicrobium rubrum]